MHFLITYDVLSYHWIQRGALQTYCTFFFLASGEFLDLHAVHTRFSIYLSTTDSVLHTDTPTTRSSTSFCSRTPENEFNEERSKQRTQIRTISLNVFPSNHRAIPANSEQLLKYSSINVAFQKNLPSKNSNNLIKKY